ncbi:MAG: multiheme c-type cytochrome [Pirellula sp.]
MANQRNAVIKHRAFVLLAIGGFCSLSVAIPILKGEPPNGTPPKVQIRFTDGTQPSSKTTSDVKFTDTGKASIEAKPLLKEPSDPITVATAEEKNQKIATDWKDPWVVLYITGKQYGYMEPCGCTGLENQKGGISRRDSLLTMIRERGWEVVPIDGGNQVRRSGRQSAIKYEWSATALKTMQYQATTFGEDDLQLDIDSLLYSMIDDSAENRGLFVSANVSIEPSFDLRSKTFEVKGRKFGITGVLGDEAAKKVLNEKIVVKSAVPALKKVVAELKAEKCDYLILIAQATLEESRAIAQAIPDFNVLITAGGFGEPTFRPEIVEGTKTQMIQVGVKGMYAGLLGFFDDAAQPLRYQRVALSSQFSDSPRINELFGRYQDQLKAISYNGLGIKQLTHPSTREFVGSEKCGDCHSNAFDVWKKSPHAHATDSIIQPPERPLARHFDPECLSCHVTGWNPQMFVPYRTGFDSLEATPHMVANGCENCHGPGAKHVAAESGDIEADQKMLERLRAEMRLPLDKARDKCNECHDIDNSPDFHKDNAFESYWEQIKHYGKD